MAARSWMTNNHGDARLASPRIIVEEMYDKYSVLQPGSVLPND